MELKVSSSFGSKIWNLLSSNLKELRDLNKFKKAIKQWKPDDYPCRLCKVFVQDIGFPEKTTCKKIEIKFIMLFKIWYFKTW